MGIFSTPSIKRSVKFFVTTILLAFIFPSVINAQVDGDFRSLTSGTWTVNTTWQRYNGGTSTWVTATAGQVPSASSAVLIRNTHTVNVTTASNFFCGNLTVGEGASGILNIQGVTVTITGSTSIVANGNLTLNTSSAGTKSFNGDFTNNGTFNNTINSAVTFLGSVTNNATFTAGTTATYTFSGTARTINTTNSTALTIANASVIGSYTFGSGFAAGNPFTVSTAITLPNAASSVINSGVFITPSLTITNASGTFTNNSTATVSATFAGSTSAVFTNAANATLNIGAATVNPAIVASANPNLVNYNRTNIQTIRATTYHNLTISGSNTKTLAAATQVNKDIIVSGTATLADGAFAITGNATGTFQLGSGTGYTTTRLNTSWFPTNTPLGNYTIDNNSTVTFNAAATLLNTIPSTYGHLVFGSGTKTLPASFPIQVNGNLTLTSGLLQDNGNTISVKGNLTSTGTHSGAGKVLLTGGAAAHTIQTNASGLCNVELNDAQGATLASAFTINSTGTFTLTNGVISMNGFDFYIDNPTGGLAGSGFSASKMILQNGAGNFTHVIATSGLPITYVYPIGETTNYSPVSITVNTNATQSDLSFRVTDGQYPGDAATSYVSRYWTVPAVPATLSNYSISFGYTAGDVVGSESTYDVFTYNTATTTWTNIPATAASNVATFDASSSNPITTTTAFTVKAPVSIPSTVTIDGVGGSAGVYANLTGATGLFAALNQAVLTGNLTVNVTAAGTITEPGTVALNQVSESGAGAGTYTITIQSSNSTQRVFEGTYGPASIGLNGLIRLNGADRVTFNGGTGTDRRLLFRNLSTSTTFASVFQCLNDASDNKINNCTIEGSALSTTVGLIHIGSSVTGGTGNDNIIITNNDVKQAGVNFPGIGISGDGLSTTVENDNAQITNNNIYNIYRTSSTVAAILINGNNTGWSITGNKIYQDTPRTGTITSTIYGIYFAATSSDNMTISGNTIGYANASGTGTSSFTAGSNGFRFSAISSNGTTSTVSNTITNNIIDNISLTTNTGGSATLPAFSGVAVNGGKALVDGNYIGSTTGAPSIVVSTITATSASTSPAAIIVNSIATSGLTISNNHIGGMSFGLSTGTLAINMAGIRVNSGNVSVTGNEIGNPTASSLLVANTGTGSAFNYGIWSGASSGYTVSITNNTIRNLSTTNVGVNTSSQVAGINVNSSGNYTVDGNTISNLTSNSQSVSSTVPPVVGITATPGGTLTHSVSGNTIYALSSTAAVNSVVTGIYFTGGSAVSQINKNFIYNLRSGSGTASIVNGIHIGASTLATVSNNRLRLGYDELGNSITNSSVITGILKDNTAASNSVYYNSVYIGGTGVGATANNSYAFRRSQSGTTDNFRNNIFVNARSNAAAGGKHYAVYLNSTSTLVEDYNLFYTPGTGGVMASVAGTDQTTMAAWKGANAGLDVSSVSDDPQFEDPTNATAPNLKLKTNVATPAESGAIAISGLTDDFEATNVRTGYPLGLPQGGTAPDMGADEANLVPKDLLPPVIAVIPITGVSVACGSSQTITVTATVTDGTGVATGSLAPTLWWRLSPSGTYAAVLPSSVSGSMYTYSLNLTGVLAGQTYHYYIAAQDVATPFNIGYSHGAPVHTNVSAAPSTINSAPATFIVAATAPLSGTVTVGTGGTYTTFNGASGLFAAINSNGLSGNLTVNVINDITETATTGLNQVAYFCGGPYTITIQSSTTTLRTVSAAMTTALIQFNGADNVLVEGNSGGSGRYLRFRNTNTATGMAFQFLNDASNITIQNCDIIGMGSTTNAAVVSIGTGTTTGNTNITLNSNLLHDNGTGTYPLNLIYSSGSAGAPNNNINITNNEIYNFSAWSGGNGRRAYGINVTSTGNGSNWTITGNSFYNTSTSEANSAWTMLGFIPGSASVNNTLSGNWMGGSAAQCGGTNPMRNAYSAGSSLVEHAGMVVNAGTATINGNNMTHINIAGSTHLSFICVNILGATQATVTNNTFGTGSAGNPDNSKMIICNGGALVDPNSQRGAIIGIINTSSTTAATTYQGNNFYYLYQTGQAHGGYVTCIDHETAGPAIIRNNVINGPQAQGSGAYSGNTWLSDGIFLSPDASCSGNIIENNSVAGPFINLLDALAYGSTNYGIRVAIGASSTVSGTINNNVVWDMRNSDRAGTTEAIYVYSGATSANGNWDIINNQVTLKNNAFTSNCVGLYGIDVALNSASATNVHYNTVYISGSNGGSAATGHDFSSYAYFRNPGNSGTVVGDAADLQNNIFINTRLVSNGLVTGHFAIGNIGTSNFATNWNVSNKNLLVTGNGGKSYLGQWGTAIQTAFSNWQSASGKDAGSFTATYTAGTSNFGTGTLNPDNLVQNALSNLHINTADGQSYQFVSNRGNVLPTTTDFDGDTRTSTPDLGVDEFFICVTPVVSSNTPTNPTCAGNDGIIALSGLAASTSFTVSYDKNSTPVAGASYTSNGSGVITISGLGNGSYNNFVVSLGAGCSSTAYPSSGSITLTNPVTPVVTGNTPTQPTCAGSGTDGIIALAGLANGTTYSVTYTKNGVPVGAANFTSNGSGVVTIGSLGAGSYTNFVLTPVGGCASAAHPSSGAITLTAPVCGVNTWQGDVTSAVNDWFNAGNWSNNTVPLSCSDDALIPTSPIGGNNFPILSTASASVGNITVQDGAFVTINSTRTLSVCGNWTGGSTLASTISGLGYVVLTGGAAQQLSGLTTFTTLRVNKTTGTTATMQASSSFDINTAVELESGTLATASGLLTFKSTSTTQIAVLDNFSSGFTGSLTGNITAERYYTNSGATNQHYMGSPVSTTLAPFGAGSSSGFVTPKPTCDETALASTSVYGSVFSYDQSNGGSCSLAGWKVEANNQTATAAQGFSVVKNGSGKITVSGAPNLTASYGRAGLNSGWPTNTSLQGRPMTAGWVLVSNPYLAYLDFATQGAPTGYTSEVKVWRTTGSFAGSYQDLQAGEMIAPFQGFFVHSNSSGTYPVNGNKRTRSTAGTFQAQANDQQLSILATNTTTTLADITMVAFNSDATTAFDNDYDAQKIAGTLGRHTLYTVGANNLWMSKNIHKSIAETSTITMGFEPGISGSYTFSFDGLNSFDPTSYIMLEDRKLNTMYDVRNGDYQFTSDTADQWERFVLHFTPAAEITTVNENCGTLGNITVNQPGTANWNYTIADLNNNNATVATGSLNQTTPISQPVTGGTYSITLVDNNNYTVVKMVTVTGTTPITAIFTSSATSVEEGNDVTFNSTTAAAITTEWNFGDGTVDNTNYPNPTHTYTTPGTYTVTLTVTNRDGCTSTTTQTVTVTAKVETGINNINNKTGIKIWSNGNQVMVDFSQLTKTDVTVSIYNILGQELVNEKYGRSTIYSKAILNVEAAYVIVKVTNGESITTKKVMIANTK